MVRVKLIGGFFPSHEKTKGFGVRFEQVNYHETVEHVAEISVDIEAEKAGV